MRKLRLRSFKNLKNKRKYYKDNKSNAYGLNSTSELLYFATFLCNLIYHPIPLFFGIFQNYIYV